MEINEIINHLNSNESGLSQKEANKRLKKYGKNKITDAKKQSKIRKFLNQFNDLMIIILIISSLVSFTLSIINNESFIDSIIIIFVVVLNAILGYIQELKSENAIEALKQMQVSNVKVRRDNKIFIINSEDIVKGDIILLEAGDNVPADARIIWSASLKTDESSLTGESIPVIKNSDTINNDTIISSRTNMIYSGTNIVYGKCHAIVCETAMNTEFGKIANALNEEEKEITPLQKKINNISKFLSFIIVLIILVMFIIGLIKGMKVMEIVMLSISLAVAAIPEGLPAVITITLSVGVSVMAKNKAIVRKLSSVETLGSTEIICSDKTGTITQNKMKVINVYYDSKIQNYDYLDKENILLQIMALNNDAEKSSNGYIGDPTEIALYEACEKFFDVTSVRNNNIRINELPFDSERKMMSTLNSKNDGIYLYTKGSFDSVLNRCSHIYENNKIKKLTKTQKEKLIQVEKEESLKAYRTLAYAYKKVNKDCQLDNAIENNLTFVGMTFMIDPPRDDVKKAIKECKKAHIKPIMITGDSISTAISIAREIGILENDTEAITGAELDKMSKSEFLKNINKYSVYARVSPINKYDIVNAWKQKGKIVAMTGDGVNDAPALKSANIGVGMGINGTEVSKNVSDIILTDDSFSTIVCAIKEGRRIFDNIRNVLVYLLTGNIAEILIVFIGMLCGIEIFFPIQLLYINLITDSLPAIALAFEKEDDNIMKRNIRKNDSTFFTPFIVAKISISAIIKSAAILLVYFVNLKIYDVSTSTTMAFLTLVLLEIILAYSCKNLKKNMFNKNFFKNSVMNKSVLILLVIQILVFVTPIKNLFNITSLNTFQLIYCFMIVIVSFIIDELSKGVINKLFSDQ